MIKHAKIGLCNLPVAPVRLRLLVPEHVAEWAPDLSKIMYADEQGQGLAEWVQHFPASQKHFRHRSGIQHVIDGGMRDGVQACRALAGPVGNQFQLQHRTPSLDLS